jgi:hypothetical protein
MYVNLGSFGPTIDVSRQERNHVQHIQASFDLSGDFLVVRRLFSGCAGRFEWGAA